MNLRSASWQIGQPADGPTCEQPPENLDSALALLAKYWKNLWSHHW